MLTTIKFGRIRILFGILLMAFSITSCGDDDPEELPALPSLSIDGDSELIVKNGETISVTLSLNAAGGNKSLVVNKGGGFLEEIPLQKEDLTYTYSSQSVDTNAEEGEKIDFEFILVDTKNQESSPASFKVLTAKYDQITLGGEEVFDVSIPTGGLITSGSNIKFIEGRNYYISQDLVFQDGSSLTIEPGVTVYLNADQEPSVGIETEEGTLVDVQGTETNPVVMTSSKTLTGDAEAGDWGTFEIEEIQNGTIRYLRTEYASDGFRIDNCDDTNTIEYVQTFMSDGEGFYITDGNVNLKYLVNTKSNDTGFRMGDTYNGKMQFIINVGADNDETEFYVRENASILAANLTLLGPGEDAEEGGDLIEINSTANTFKIYSSIVAESVDEDMKFNGDMPISDLTGVNVLAYSYFFNNDDPLKDNASDFFGTFDEAGVLVTNPFFNNAEALEEDGDIDFEKIAGIGVDDFVPDATTTAKESFDPSTIDAFFTSVTFIGAVENETNDWTKGWVKNPDGSIR